MMDQEKPQATAADVTIANHARTWRHAEKRAIGHPTAENKEARYHQLQKLREAIDTSNGGTPP